MQPQQQKKGGEGGLRDDPGDLSSATVLSPRHCCIESIVATCSQYLRADAKGGADSADLDAPRNVPYGTCLLDPIGASSPYLMTPGTRASSTGHYGHSCTVELHGIDPSLAGSELPSARCPGARRMPQEAQSNYLAYYLLVFSNRRQDERRSGDR